MTKRGKPELYENPIVISITTTGPDPYRDSISAIAAASPDPDDFFQHDGKDVDAMLYALSDYLGE